jgi:hypothetical protein
MCEPISLGIATAASGAMGAIGSHQSASAQANATNQAAINNYKYQLKVRERNWDQTRNVYGQKVHQYHQTIDENQMAAARGYNAAQMNLTEQFRQAAFGNENRLAKLVRSRGNFAASNRTGRSTDRLAAEQMMQFGRGNAVMAENLMTGQNKYTRQTENLNRQLLSANRQAYSKVAVAPQPGVAPVAPTMMPGPSGLSLASGLLDAGMSGVNTADQMKPGGLFGQRVD